MGFTGGQGKDTTQFLFNDWWVTALWSAAAKVDLKLALVGGDLDSAISSGIPELSQNIFPIGGVLDLLTYAVGINSSDQDLTITSFIGGTTGAAGNQTITIGAGLTGTFQDVTNTDVIPNNEVVCTNHNRSAGVGTTGRAQSTMRFRR